MSDPQRLHALLAQRTPAYLATRYQVDAPGGPCTIRIGEVCAELDALLDAHGARCWAYVTACNPGDTVPDASENQKRMAALSARLQAEDRRCLPGAGVGDDGAWPPEPSLLVLDLDEAAAVQLGRDCGQLAVVCGERGGVARLVSCLR